MSHLHEHTDADKWTKIAAIAEGVTGFISNTYWLATLFDIISGAEESAAGISFYAMGFGVIIASLSASGAAYSHYVLNKQYQHTGNTQFSINGIMVGDLTKLQKLALIGDYLSHIGEITGPLTFVADLVANNRLPRWGKALVQCGATLFGAVASVANVRTCKNSMVESNKNSRAIPTQKLVC
jgi:hypothetical protein